MKLAWGEMREDGYLISLYYSEPGGEATVAAGFGGSKRIEHLSDGAPGRIVGRPDSDVPACFVRKLVRTSKPVVGAERSDVSDPDKAEKQYDRERAREDFSRDREFDCHTSAEIKANDSFLRS
jgi:hypothetical protein